MILLERLCGFKASSSIPPKPNINLGFSYSLDHHQNYKLVILTLLCLLYQDTLVMLIHFLL